MRGHTDAYCLQPIIATNAVVLMNNQVSGRQFTGFGNQFIRPAAAAWGATNPFTQQILFRNKGNVIRNKPALKPEG